jgi:hypothetical protein
MSNLTMVPLAEIVEAWTLVGHVMVGGSATATGGGSGGGVAVGVVGLLQADSNSANSATEDTARPIVQEPFRDMSRAFYSNPTAQPGKNS